MSVKQIRHFNVFLRATLVRTTIVRITMLLALAVSLTACGFHLRGNIPLPEGIKNLYVQAPEGTFKDQLEEVLAKGGATIAPSIAAADAVVNVTAVDTNRNVNTIDDRGKVDSYELSLRVTYSLDDPEGKVVRKRTSLRESREYDFDPELVVESEAEEEQLVSAMEEELSLRMVRQLSTVNYYQRK